MLVIGSVIVVVGALVVFLTARSLPPELVDVVRSENEGRRHLAAGEPVPEYGSDPATSGDHSASPAPCGVYREEVLDVNRVHSLEHGAIGIQYDPDLPDEERNSLEAFARQRGTHVVVAPEEGLEAPVVLTAWTRMLSLDGANLDTIEVFYDQFARKGPEAGVACPVQVDQS